MTNIKIKMYKAGQLLTINHKVYRVKRARSSAGICLYCDAHIECFTRRVGSISCTGTPSDCYLQLVKPKSSLG